MCLVIKIWVKKAPRLSSFARAVFLFHSQSKPPEISPPQFRNDKFMMIWYAQAFTNGVTSIPADLS